jgi:putative addiction module killer protein
MRRIKKSLDQMSLLEDNNKRMGVRPRHLLKYITETGRCPFDEWLAALNDKRTQATVSNRLLRVAQGNFGLCRNVGGNLMELKIDFGPGFRVYFAEDGDTIVVLLCGGDKSTQTKDIERAKEYWQDYTRE